MPKLEVSYDIPQSEFVPLISCFTTPISTRIHDKTNLGRVLRLDLEEQMEELMKAAPYVRDHSDTHYLKGKIDRNHAHYYAVELGLFPIETYDDAQKILHERYAIPHLPGDSTEYDILFCPRGCGLYEWVLDRYKVMDKDDLEKLPMKIIMEPDFRFGTEIFLLRDWYNRFKKEGKEDMVKKRDETIKNTSGLCTYDGYGGFDHILKEDPPRVLTGMPTTAEEFEKRIKKAIDEFTIIQVYTAINMIRFYWDFIGKPIEEGGYHPAEIRVTGTENFELLLSDQDVKTITQYPTLTRDIVWKQIMKGMRPRGEVCYS